MQPTNASPSAVHPAPTSCTQERWQGGALETFVRETLQALPRKPSAVSHLQGPYVQLGKVDNNTVDVTVTHKFRAHFDPATARSVPHGTTVTIREASASSEGELANCLPAASPVERSSSDTAGSFRDNGRSSSGSVSEPSECGEGAVTLATVNDPLNQPLNRAPKPVAGQLTAPAQPLGLATEAGHWQIDPSQVLLGKRLAVGGFAEVYVGNYQGTIVAVKLLLSAEPSILDKFKREVALLLGLRHPNLLLCMGYTLHPRPAIITEYMQRGSLFKVLRAQGGPLDARLARSVVVGVARGMAHLHAAAPPILHCDLKSPNILLDERWRVKIADFGLARVRHAALASGTVGTGAGTPEWMAPEVLRGERCDEAADVYSFGVVLWEVLTGQVPWEQLHPLQVVGAVGFQRCQLPAPTAGDPFLISLCQACLAPEPAARPRFPAIVRMLDEQYGPPRWLTMSTSLSEAEVAARSGSSTPACAAPPQPGLPCGRAQTSGEALSPSPSTPSPHSPAKRERQSSLSDELGSSGEASAVFTNARPANDETNSVRGKASAANSAAAGAPAAEPARSQRARPARLRERAQRQQARASARSQDPPLPPAGGALPTPFAAAACDPLPSSPTSPASPVAAGARAAASDSSSGSDHTPRAGVAPPPAVFQSPFAALANQPAPSDASESLASDCDMLANLSGHFAGSTGLRASAVSRSMQLCQEMPLPPLRPVATPRARPWPGARQPLAARQPSAADPGSPDPSCAGAKPARGSENDENSQGQGHSKAPLQLCSSGSARTSHLVSTPDCTDCRPGHQAEPCL